MNMNAPQPESGFGNQMGQLAVFGGTAGQELTTQICAYLGISPGVVHIESFPDGETFVKLVDDVRGRDCFLVQPTCPPVNDNLIELLCFIDCFRRASASRITTVIPYFGYARQDRKAEGRTPITAKLIANMITAAGAHRALTMDLHADQIQGFFDIPVDHLTAVPVIAEHFKNLALDDTTIVSPDVGNLKTAKKFAHILGGEIAVIDKRRESGESVEMMNIIGRVAGKNVLLFDDMVATAGTLIAAAKLVRDRGAQAIYCGATHAVFAGPCIQRLARADLSQICVTNTIPVPNEAKEKLPSLKVLSVAPLLGEAIRRIHRHESVSALFSP